MKWNWGTKLILVFSCFIAAMIMLVVMSMKQKVQLVAKDYYKDELRYQQVIHATSLANALSAKVTIKKQGGFVIVQLPPEMAGKQITGTIFFYCPANDNKDRKLQLQTNELAQQQISLQQLLTGSYIVKIEWTHKGQQYYTEQSFINQ
jgi:hypothetical protein